MRAAIFIVAWIVTGAAQAGELGVAVSGFSHHFTDEKSYNERNIGLGIVYEHANGFATLGAFENSDYRQSVYLLYGKKASYRRGAWLAEAGVMAGGISGYDDAIVPAVLPMIAFGHRRARVNLTFAPKMTDAMDAVVALQFEFRR